MALSTFSRGLVVAFSLTALIVAATAQTADAPQSDGVVKIDDLKVGSPVFGSDGIKIGEVNRIKAESNGRVTEVQVTTGGPAGINAKVIAITPDKIGSSGRNDVKLKVSGADAKKLPVITEGEKG